MAAEGSSNNNALNRGNAQLVLERAQKEYAKTKADLAAARTQLEKAQKRMNDATSEQDLKTRQAAFDAATEKVTTLESELATASEDLRQAEEAHEATETAEMMARNAHKAAARSQRASGIPGLERKLEKAKSEFEAARRVIRFAGGDAKRASDIIARAEAELASTREAYDTAEASLRAANREMDEAISEYLANKNAETERRYDTAIVARSDAEDAVARTKRRFEEATARNNEAQKSAHLVRDAEIAQETYEKKKFAFDEATKALNRAITAQKAAENRVHTTEANLETKVAEQEAAARAIDSQSTTIAGIMDALKTARKELAAAKNARDKIVEAHTVAKNSVSEAQQRVDSLSVRLGKLDDIIVDAKKLLAE